jgi:hypothetical protein
MFPYTEEELQFINKYKEIICLTLIHLKYLLMKNIKNRFPNTGMMFLNSIEIGL